MLSKNELKDIQSLCHKKQRDERELFVAEGPKMAEELLNSQYEIVRLYATKPYLEKHEGFNCPTTEVTEDELQKMSNLSHANQVLLVARQRHYEHEPIVNNHIVLVLDAIQDPGNMGTIIRIADWFGVTQIVCTVDCVELYNPKVVQSTMGSICRVNVWYKNVSEWMQQVNIPIYGAMLNGTNIYTMQEIDEGILVIGNEGKGISEELKSFITHAVTIPKSGGAESLNAAVATGIILGGMRNMKV